MTPPRPTLPQRVSGILAPFFPSHTKAEPDTQRSVLVEIDTRNRAAFDADGLSNDFVGTGYFLVTETTGHDGWFGNRRTTYLTKRFSYFLNDSGTLVLRELNPTSPLYPKKGLSTVPAMRGSSSPKSGQTHRPPTFEEARAWAAERSSNDPISAFIGNIDSRPGNEVELSRGTLSLGIVNLFNDIFPQPSS